MIPLEGTSLVQIESASQGAPADVTDTRTATQNTLTTPLSEYIIRNLVKQYYQCHGSMYFDTYIACTGGAILHVL